MKRTLCGTLLASVCMIAVPGAALGQEANTSQPAPATDDARDAGFGEILVTAQRRSESAQRVPVSLVALSSGDLETANITSVQDLGRVAPSFNAFRSGQSANTRLSIRGIGSAGNSAIEPSVGAYVDGIYIPRPGPLLAGLNDVAGVEVLRGPQGTLFGRNASVGAISIRTAEPGFDPEGSLLLEAGNFGRIRTIGMINMPANDSIAFRFSALFDRFHGYGVNANTDAHFGGNKTVSLRGAVKANITPELTWVLRGDYQRQRGDGVSILTVDAATVTPTAAANFATRTNGLIPVLDNTYGRRVRQPTSGSLDDRQFGGSSEFALDIGASTLKLLSGYRKWDNSQSEEDIVSANVPLFGRDATYLSKSHSQELQFLTPADAPLSAVFGLYYFRERYDIDTAFNLRPGFCDIYIRNTTPARVAACQAAPQEGAADVTFNQITESYAAFAQATYKITPQWDITAGIRYSHDKKRGELVSTRNNPTYPGATPDVADDLRFSGGKVTYRVATTFRPTNDVMLFATYSTGYKSGGFDTGTGTAVGNNRVFFPETVTNYEIGAKTELLDRKLRLNATLFRMDVNDFQLRSYNGTFYAVRNAGNLRQQGVEFDIAVRPAQGLELSLAATRLDSEYTDFRNAPPLPGLSGVQDLTGARAPYSPKWQGTAAIDYAHGLSSDLEMRVNIHAGFNSDIDVGIAGDGNPQGVQPGYALLGARLAIGATDERWEAALSVENITDKGYCVTKYGQVLSAGLRQQSNGTGTLRCVLGEPRTARASVKFRF